MSTSAVVLFIFWSSHKVSKSDDLFLYYTSPFIVNIKANVHCPMTILYNFFVFSIKISSRSMYCLTRIYHIFILIFDSYYFSIRSSGMCLVLKFVTGSFRSVIISTMSSAFLKFFRKKLFRTS